MNGGFFMCHKTRLQKRQRIGRVLRRRITAILKLTAELLLKLSMTKLLHCSNHKGIATLRSR